MNDVIKKLQDAIENQDLEKVYQEFHAFFENLSLETQYEELIDVAEYAESIGFYEEAKRAFLLLTEYEPAESSWTIQLAELLINEGEEDQALSILYDIPSTDLNYPLVLLLEAQLYSQQGYLDVAEKKLFQAKELVPDEPMIDFYLGSLFSQSGELDRAIYFLERYTGQAEKSLETEKSFQLLIQNYLSTNQFDKALSLMDEIDFGDLDDQTLFLLGREFSFNQQYDKAKESYAELLGRNEENLDAQYGMAELLSMQHKFYESIQTLEALLEKADFYIAAYLLKSENERALHDLSAAAKTLSKAVQLEPDSPELLSRYVELLLELEDYEEVVTLLEKANNDGLYEVKFDYYLARAYDALEDYDQAMRHYLACEDELKDSSEFIVDFALFLKAEGQREKALALVENGLDLEPLNSDLIELRAKLVEETEEQW